MQAGGGEGLKIQALTLRYQKEMSRRRCKFIIEHIAWLDFLTKWFVLENNPPQRHASHCHSPCLTALLPVRLSSGSILW